MFLWRISNHDSLDGRGGLLASARWHTQGRPIVYLAATPAGALVEVLVNLELDPVPPTYTLLKVEAPDDIALARLDTSLPENWRQDLLWSRSRGDEWLAAGHQALLEVPSAILPDTYNLLLNSLHPDAQHIHILSQQAYAYDRRLFKPRR
ncbi:MAG: RES family NAD+ phosphorylase [Terriglobales bacterium]